MEEKLNSVSFPKETDKNKKENMFGVSYDPRRGRYIVRLLTEKGKPLIYKEFSVNKYRNPNEAKKEAIRYRDQQVVNWLIPCKRTRESIDLKNNKTGITGVHRKTKNGGGIYVATWYDENNRLQRTQFSENKWSAKQAFFMAWATRISKRKIFKQNKETGEFVENPDNCFDIVYNEVSKEQAEEIWEKERDRILNKK